MSQTREWYGSPDHSASWVRLLLCQFIHSSSQTCCLNLLERTENGVQFGRAQRGAQATLQVFLGGVDAEMLAAGMSSAEDGARSGSSSPLETSAGLSASGLGGCLGSGAHPNVFVR